MFNIEFEFCPIVAPFEDFPLDRLRIDPDEKLVVNFMLQLHHLLKDDGTQSVEQLLTSVSSLSPALVTLTEYDAALNGPAFHPRFMDALHFYCAVFDSLDATMPRDCQDRLTVESSFFAKEVENIVAYEGAERTERHESTERWINLMQSTGFVNVQLSHYAHSQAQQLLWQYCESFRLQKTSGCISLTWQDRSLITVSAWKCL